MTLCSPVISRYYLVLPGLARSLIVYSNVCSFMENNVLGLFVSVRFLAQPFLFNFVVKQVNFSFVQFINVYIWFKAVLILFYITCLSI